MGSDNVNVIIASLIIVVDSTPVHDKGRRERMTMLVRNKAQVRGHDGLVDVIWQHSGKQSCFYLLQKSTLIF